jgi:hypothetical protein
MSPRVASYTTQPFASLLLTSTVYAIFMPHHHLLTRCSVLDYNPHYNNMLEQIRKNERTIPSFCLRNIRCGKRVKYYSYFLAYQWITKIIEWRNSRCATDNLVSVF